MKEGNSWDRGIGGTRRGGDPRRSSRLRTHFPIRKPRMKGEESKAFKGRSLSRPQPPFQTFSSPPWRLFSLPSVIAQVSIGARSRAPPWNLEPSVYTHAYSSRIQPRMVNKNGSARVLLGSFQRTDPENGGPVKGRKEGDEGRRKRRRRKGRNNGRKRERERERERVSKTAGYCSNCGE